VSLYSAFQKISLAFHLAMGHLFKCFLT